MITFMIKGRKEQHGDGQAFGGKANALMTAFLGEATQKRRLDTRGRSLPSACRERGGCGVRSCQRQWRVTEHVARETAALWGGDQSGGSLGGMVGFVGAGVGSASAGGKWEVRELGFGETRRRRERAVVQRGERHSLLLRHLARSTARSL